MLRCRFYSGEAVLAAVRVRASAWVRTIIAASQPLELQHGILAPHDPMAHKHLHEREAVHGKYRRLSCPGALLPRPWHCWCWGLLAGKVILSRQTGTGFSGASMVQSHHLALVFDVFSQSTGRGCQMPRLSIAFMGWMEQYGMQHHNMEMYRFDKNPPTPGSLAARSHESDTRQGQKAM